MFSTYVAAGAVLIALLALYIAAQATSYAKSCTEWMVDNNEKSVSLKRMVLLETEMTETTEALEAVRKSMHKLRSRIHMRNLNETNETTEPGEPDSIKDPEGWKRWMMNQQSPTNGA